MLKAVFYKREGAFRGFSVSGHADHGTQGNDIVCAAISSAVELVCNTVTDYFKADAKADVKDNMVSLSLNERDAASEQLIAALHDHIEYYADRYGKIKLEIR